MHQHAFPQKSAGVYFWGAQHCTVTDLEIAYSKPRYTPQCACGNQNGHRGVWMERGSDNLLTRFRVNAPLVHDVTLSWTEMHTVISEGWGMDLNVDHHRNSPYGELAAWTGCCAYACARFDYVFGHGLICMLDHAFECMQWNEGLTVHLPASSEAILPEG